MRYYEFIVLGGGVAGLAFALEVAERGHSVVVLEKDREVGGLSRTLEYKGFRFDYSAHRFHSANAAVMSRVKEIMGPNFTRHVQRSRIRMFGKFLKYPFELQNLLRAMPLHRSFLSGIDFAGSLIHRNFQKHPGSFLNYRDWFVYHFGHRLYKVMCEPYTSKIWKTPPELISADWADQRFQGVNIRKLIAKTIQKAIRLDFSSYSLEDENLAPDGGEFFYAPLGAQEIPERYAARIRATGNDIALSQMVTDIDVPTRTVRARSGWEGRYTKAVISTIPLHNLFKASHSDDRSVEADLAGLKYMNIIFVYLIIDKPRVSNDHWLYFADDDIIFNRSVEFKTWSAGMAPADKTALCLDITCFDGDPTWTLSKEELVKRSIEGAVKADLIKPQDVTDSLVLKITEAYPFYDLDYKRKLLNAVRYLERSGEIFCLGRTGIFRYNNSDGSIEMGMELAARLINPAWQPGDNNASVLRYQFEHISY